MYGATMNLLGPLLAIGLTLVGTAGALAQSGSAPQILVKIGTSGSEGTSYAAGDAICSMVNKAVQERNLLCTVEPLSGSVAIGKAILAGRLSMGIVQSDVQNDLFLGQRNFGRGGPHPELRALFSIFPEPYTAVARADAGVVRFEDFKDKIFNIGSTGSGSHAAIEQLFSLLGWKVSEFPLVYQLGGDEVGPALCDGTIAGFMIATGMHSQQIEMPARTCGAKLIPLSSPVLDQMVDATEYLQPFEIPGGTYSGNPDPIKTYGVIATLLTLDSLPDYIAYNMVKATFENLETFRKANPSFADLTRQQMVGYGNTAPLHPGAVRYFKEKGLN
ncbi:MAG: TAXI family TRAP transporter solute-binding subunit [Azospirillum sp.]|nr:TAXI family TRAP transporter solute-binding subunit [Azospirillum sp.]